MGSSLSTTTFPPSLPRLSSELKATISPDSTCLIKTFMGCLLQPDNWTHHRRHIKMRLMKNIKKVDLKEEELKAQNEMIAAGSRSASPSVNLRRVNRSLRNPRKGCRLTVWIKSTSLRIFVRRWERIRRLHLESRFSRAPLVSNSDYFHLDLQVSKA